MYLVFILLYVPIPVSVEDGRPHLRPRLYDPAAYVGRFRNAGQICTTENRVVNMPESTLILLFMTWK